MSLVKRFLGSYLEQDEMEAGLFQKEDGTVWVRNPDGTADQLPGASGGGGIAARGPFPVAFDDAGLVDGVSFYAPTVGDLLLDAWVEILTLFDGTTPRLDIGTFVATDSGIFDALGGTALALDAGLATEAAGTGFRRTSGGAVPYSMQSGAGYAGAGSGMGIFAAANHLKVVVSQDGSKGGDDPGASQGAANIYIVTATPVAP